MAKGFGIAALVVAILAVFVPVVSIVVVWFALILAAIAGLLGNRVYPIAVVATCLLLSANLRGERIASPAAPAQWFLLPE